AAGPLPGAVGPARGGGGGGGAGAVRPAGRRAGPLPDRRRPVPARRLGGGEGLLRPCPGRATRPFLGAILPRGVSPDVARLGGGQGGPERLPGPTARLRLGVPFSELCPRAVASGRRGRGRFPAGTPARPERGRA